MTKTVAIRLKSVMCRAVVTLALLLCLSAGAPPARAQGCVMCYTSAQAADAKAKRALNDAILILITPTLFIFGTILSVAWKRRNSP
jgi:hypothetical protein